MSTPEQFGMDAETFTELRRKGHDIVHPPVERNFGDDSDAEFKASTEIALPYQPKILPGKTPLEAHRRIQASKGLMS